MNKAKALLLVGLVAATSFLGSLAQEKVNSIAITNVTVVNVATGVATPGQNVLIRGNRIVAVEPAGRAKIPEDARIIRGDGKFLIPGLWDAHIHWYQKDLLPLFIANGVTGARLMWGSPFHIGWAREAEAGLLVGPRIYMAGAIVDGPQPIWPNSVAVGSAEEGRKAVRDTKAMGADFVKVYSLLPRDAFFAIADEAKKQRLPFAGHVPSSVTAVEASDAGQLTIEHLTGVIGASSSRQDELRKQVAAAGRDLAARQQIGRAALESFDPTKAQALYAHFRKNGTWQSPTLVVLRNTAHLDDPAITGDRRVKYMPESIRKSWDPANDFRFRNRTPDEAAFAKKQYAKNKEIVGEMARAGVGILAGTDVLNPYCFPGFSLHDELVLLVEAGLSPLQALQAATINVARMMGREKDLGSIEQGKLADVVLLDANPLDDIRNTQKLRAVIFNGRLFDRAALDRLLADAEASAGKPARPATP